MQARWMFALIPNVFGQTVLRKGKNWYCRTMHLTLCTLLSDKTNFKLDSAYNIFATKAKWDLKILVLGYATNETSWATCRKGNLGIGDTTKYPKALDWITPKTVYIKRNLLKVTFHSGGVLKNITCSNSNQICILFVFWCVLAALLSNGQITKYGFGEVQFISVWEWFGLVTISVFSF